jgi:hypothetical protein
MARKFGRARLICKYLLFPYCCTVHTLMCLGLERPVSGFGPPPETSNRSGLMERWIWFSIEWWYADSDSDTVIHDPAANPLYWVAFACPLENVTTYLPTKCLMDIESDERRDVRMDKLDYDFSRGGLPLFEFNIPEGVTDCMGNFNQGSVGADEGFHSWHKVGSAMALGGCRIVARIEEKAGRTKDVVNGDSVNGQPVKKKDTNKGNEKGLGKNTGITNSGDHGVIHGAERIQKRARSVSSGRRSRSRLR